MRKTPSVTTVDDLNFWLKHFAPRLRLRVSPDAVIAATSQDELHVPASISFREHGRGEILGIGDEHAGAPAAVTVRLFSAAGVASADYDILVTKFFGLVLRRLHRSGIFIRPVTIVEGLNSLPRDVEPRVRETLLRALGNAGAAAVVIDPALN